MNGRVIFTKDFQNKTKKPITHKELGELRVKEIIKAENDGRLSQAKTRAEVGELVGIDKERVAVANSWITRQIKLGKLTETLVKFDKNNKAEYEYHYFENKVAKPIRKTKPSKDTIPEEVIHNAVQPTSDIQKQKIESPQQKIDIPLNKEMLEGGLSLTLNINFIFGK